ncbi:hypothetical protein Q8F57_018240 [Paraburkholderia terrae]|uniref:hypothetical protein n=1 Tax=Paraburkholderia terrae TaxID=311230 RepID=UPI00296AB83D|nr:hypothetical protein [Paraburkholderia terrae]MDW3655215.1 hypothetical protein [Paraburkholderia terrae]
MIDLVLLGDTTDHGGEVVTAFDSTRYKGGQFECDNAPDGGFRVTLTFGREA